MDLQGLWAKGSEGTLGKAQPPNQEGAAVQQPQAPPQPGPASSQGNAAGGAGAGRAARLAPGPRGPAARSRGHSATHGVPPPGLGASEGAAWKQTLWPAPGSLWKVREVFRPPQ